VGVSLRYKLTVNKNDGIVLRWQNFDMFSRFYTIPACDERSDRRTELSHLNVARCTHERRRTSDKNYWNFKKLSIDTVHDMCSVMWIRVNQITWLAVHNVGNQVCLTLWRPLLSYGSAIKCPMSDRVKSSFVIFDIRALWRSALSVRVPGCQKLQTTGGLTRSGTGCFIAVPIWQKWASKG